MGVYSLKKFGTVGGMVGEWSGKKVGCIFSFSFRFEMERLKQDRRMRIGVISFASLFGFVKRVERVLTTKHEKKRKKKKRETMLLYKMKEKGSMCSPSAFFLSC
jgi:hypothetical protein